MTTLINNIKSLAGNDYLYLSEAFKIGSLRFWAVCVSPQDEIFLMDADEQWHKLESSDSRYMEIIEKLEDRVSEIVKAWREAV